MKKVLANFKKFYYNIITKEEEKNNYFLNNYLYIQLNSTE